MQIDSTTQTNNTTHQSKKQNSSSATNNTSFQDTLNQSKKSSNTTTQETREQKSQTTQELVADLLSVLKTGFTVSELEYIEKLLAQIKQKMQDELKDKQGSDAQKEINKMLKALEEAILAIQKRLTGEAVIEAKDNKSGKKFQSSDPTIQEFEKRIDKIESAITKVKNTYLEQTDYENIELMNKKISELIISDRPLPSDAYEKIKQQYIDSMTDEKFDELVDKLGINSLSDSDKALFKSIIADRHISDEEIKGLSYEQMKTLGKFVFKEDENGKYIEETLINTDIKAGTLLSIPVLSKDNNFNKALFSMVEKMDDNMQIIGFMYPITGTSHSSKIIAFPLLQHINYDNNPKNIDEIIQDLIDVYELKLKNTLKANDVEYYQNQISMYTDLYNLYSEFKGEKENKLDTQEYTIDIRQQLIDDLLSVMNTGLSISEIEELEKLVKDINQLIEESKTKKVSVKRVEDMIEKLELKLEELSRRLGIKGEIEVDKNLELENTEGLSQIMKDFKSVVQSLKNALDEIKEKKELTQQTSTDEELKLIKQLKEFGK